MKIQRHLDPTLITSGGRVIRQGNGRDGVVVVDDLDHLPLLDISEASDEATVDLVLLFAPGAKLIKSDPKASASLDYPDYEPFRTYELAIDRSLLKPLRRF
jgi:hypothetical protein